MSTAIIATSRHGSKHACADCGGKFYDLGKADACCPQCGGKPVVGKLPRGGYASRKSVRASPTK